MKTTKIIALCLFIGFQVSAQVKTNFNNEMLISEKGKFSKSYRKLINQEITARNINELLEAEKRDILKQGSERPFQIAVPIALDLDIPKLISWTTDKDFAFGKYTFKLHGALSVSINFDKFYLPEGTEMYVYNENGEMITGLITENENNPNQIWGSWVYQGEYLTIEIKTPDSTKNQLILHTSNIACGYKEMYKSLRVGGFGQSESCNINVICPLGGGWEAERNSVALVLDNNGSTLCSGAMIMNACNTSRPFFLTADHCLPDQNVTTWRFTFQAWSPTCTTTQNNVGTTFNGSTLRANWSGSDFCLVELNNPPPTNSGIFYSGWNRSSNPSQSATGIHHPNGDVMKISRDNEPIIRSGGNVYNNSTHWEVRWNQGITAQGSSGSPLFDQNRRIIGQLHGGTSFCATPNAPD